MRASATKEGRMLHRGAQRSLWESWTEAVLKRSALSHAAVVCLSGCFRLQLHALLLCHQNHPASSALDLILQNLNTSPTDGSKPAVAPTQEDLTYAKYKLREYARRSTWYCSDATETLPSNRLFLARPHPHSHPHQHPSHLHR